MECLHSCRTQFSLLKIQKTAKIVKFWQYSEKVGKGRAGRGFNGRFHMISLVISEPVSVSDVMENSFCFILSHSKLWTRLLNKLSQFWSKMVKVDIFDIRRVDSYYEFNLKPFWALSFFGPIKRLAKTLSAVRWNVF